MHYEVSNVTKTRALSIERFISNHSDPNGPGWPLMAPSEWELFYYCNDTWSIFLYGLFMYSVIFRDNWKVIVFFNNWRGEFLKKKLGRPLNLKYRWPFVNVYGQLDSFWLDYVYFMIRKVETNVNKTSQVTLKN